MAQEPKISARLAGGMLTCRLTVDRPIHPGAPVFFRAKEQAKGSWLAEEIFKLPDVAAVKVSGETVSITREDAQDWPRVTRGAAAKIREALAKGVPAVAPGTPSNVLSPKEIREKVQEVLDREVNPSVAGHGGVIELIDVKDATVYIRMGGGCHGCAQSTATLKQGVERSLRGAVPELDEILDVTDHAGGTNPYYAPAKH